MYMYHKREHVVLWQGGEGVDRAGWTGQDREALEEQGNEDPALSGSWHAFR